MAHGRGRESRIPSELRPLPERARRTPRRNPNLMNDRTRRTLFVALSSAVLVLTTTSVALVPSERALPDRDVPRIERVTSTQLDTL